MLISKTFVYTVRMHKRFFVSILLALSAFLLTFVAVKYFRFPGQLRNVDTAEITSQGLNITPFSSFEKGEVVEIVSAIERTWEGPPKVVYVEQEVKVQLSGKQGQSIITTKYSEPPNSKPRQFLKVGEQVVVGTTDSVENAEYAVVDRYRLPRLGFLALLFFGLVLALLRKKGMGTLFGLFITIFILLFYLAPNLLLGTHGPLVIMISTGCMAVVSALFAHGWNKQGLSGSLSNLCVVLLIYGLSAIVMRILHLYGSGSEDATILQTAGMGFVNTRHVLLAGVMIGSLGALDDVTSAQTATVEEIHNVAKNLSPDELFWKAMRVGREHVSALVNTLALVYASASMPLILVLVLMPSQPLWVILNSETVSEQVVSILVASLGMVIAVPVSTLFAVLLLNKRV